jgi:hypothetical protein
MGNRDTERFRMSLAELHQLPVAQRLTNIKQLDGTIIAANALGRLSNTEFAKLQLRLQVEASEANLLLWQQDDI